MQSGGISATPPAADPTGLKGLVVSLSQQTGNRGGQRGRLDTKGHNLD
jgi:hypothetical protein